MAVVKVLPVVRIHVSIVVGAAPNPRKRQARVHRVHLPQLGSLADDRYRNSPQRQHS